MCDPQELDACKKDFDDIRAETVCDEQIRINGVQLVDEDFKHRSLTREHLDVRFSLLLDLLLDVEWKRLLVKFP